MKDKLFALFKWLFLIGIMIFVAKIFLVLS